MWLSNEVRTALQSKDTIKGLVWWQQRRGSLTPAKPAIEIEPKKNRCLPEIGRFDDVTCPRKGKTGSCVLALN